MASNAWSAGVKIQEETHVHFAPSIGYHLGISEVSSSNLVHGFIAELPVYFIRSGFHSVFELHALNVTGVGNDRVNAIGGAIGAGPYLKDWDAHLSFSLVGRRYIGYESTFLGGGRVGLAYEKGLKLELEAAGLFVETSRSNLKYSYVGFNVMYSFGMPKTEKRPESSRVRRVNDLTVD